MGHLQGQGAEEEEEARPGAGQAACCCQGPQTREARVHASARVDKNSRAGARAENTATLLAAARAQVAQLEAQRIKELEAEVATLRRAAAARSL